jgi:hypothetical protein
MMERSPRVPVPRAMAFRATARSPVSVALKLTPLYDSSWAYCARWPRGGGGGGPRCGSEGRAGPSLGAGVPGQA